MSNKTLNQSERKLLAHAKIADLYGLVRFMNDMGEQTCNDISSHVCDLVMLKIVAAGWIQPEQSANAFHVFMHYFGEKVSAKAIQRTKDAYKLFGNKLGLYLLDMLDIHEGDFQNPLQNENILTFAEPQKNYMSLASVK